MNVFVGRQCIYDKNREVVSYELLYRSNSENNSFNNIDENNATLSVVINYFTTIGMNNISENKPAFVNFTEDLLKSNTDFLNIPPEHMVIEILETVEVSEEINTICKNLSTKGYKIALDDFEFDEKYIELLKVADIVKIDFLITRGIERKDVVRKIKSINDKIIFLAEKVETNEDYLEAKSYGYSLFQGYYFDKPSIISIYDIPVVKINCLRLIGIINSENTELEELRKHIIRDVSISYKILKIVNSAYFSLNRKIESVDEAINFIGEKKLKVLASVFLMQNACGENSYEWDIIKRSLIRARFCETIATRTNIKERCSDAYIMGMFSMVDCILNRPLEEVLNDICINNDIKDALLKKVYNDFYYIYELVIDYERGNWDDVVVKSKKYGIKTDDIIEAYMDSLGYTLSIMN